MVTIPISAVIPTITGTVEVRMKVNVSFQLMTFLTRVPEEMVLLIT